MPERIERWMISLVLGLMLTQPLAAAWSAYSTFPHHKTIRIGAKTQRVAVNYLKKRLSQNIGDWHYAVLEQRGNQVWQREQRYLYCPKLGGGFVIESKPRRASTEELKLWHAVM